MPKKKHIKKAMTPAKNYAHFLQKIVVRGKVVKVEYFKEQGLGLFLDKLEAQGWLGLFTNTHRGCFVRNLAEFYANYVVTKGVVTSAVNGHDLRSNAKELGEILGVPVEGFDVYVREDKRVLGAQRLLKLTQKLSEESNLTAPLYVKKGKITRMHRLLF